MERLPYFTPLGWGVIFGVGFCVGAWIAYCTLSMLGLW